MTEQPGGPDDLDAAIARAAGRVRARARLASRRNALDTALGVHAIEVDALGRAARHEQSQVDALEGLTLDRVLAALRGSRDDDLKRERAETQAAAYRLAQAQARGTVLRPSWRSSSAAWTRSPTSTGSASVRSPRRTPSCAVGSTTRARPS